MEAKMNYIMEEMMPAGGAPEGSSPKCGAYLKTQADMCECVPEDEEEDKFESFLESFYKQYAPNKAESGVDMDAIYSKFKKTQKADIVAALVNKYKKAGTIAKKDKADDPLANLMGGLGGKGGLGGLGDDEEDDDEEDDVADDSKDEDLDEEDGEGEGDKDKKEDEADSDKEGSDAEKEADSDSDGEADKKKEEL
jgi:hypothetical protein